MNSLPAEPIAFDETEHPGGGALTPGRPPWAPSLRMAGTAFGCPRESLGNRFVYSVISPRARGLSLGVNMNPDKLCNFNCPYCEVNRRAPSAEPTLHVPTMIEELERAVVLAQSGRLREHEPYRSLPADLVQLRQVNLSGDGEPTLSPNFAEAVEAVMHLRARGRVPFFKVALITNASGLDRPAVVAGLRLFTSIDEIWAKLEAGTQRYMDEVNQPGLKLEQILANILNLARQRPVIIQSLFPSIGGEGPAPAEIQSYAEQLRKLREAGARIPMVQIYSATRPTPNSRCGHLPLRTLSRIAERVRTIAGLPAEVF